MLEGMCQNSNCLSLVYRRRQWKPHSSPLAWKIPWMEEPGRLQSMGSKETDTTMQLHFHFSLSCIGEGNGNPLQCSCLENPGDGGAWWAAVYGVAESDMTEVTQQQQQQHWSTKIRKTQKLTINVQQLLQQFHKVNLWASQMLTSHLICFFISFFLYFEPQQHLSSKFPNHYSLVSGLCLPCFSSSNIINKNTYCSYMSLQLLYEFNSVREVDNL